MSKEFKFQTISKEDTERIASEILRDMRSGRNWIGETEAPTEKKEAPKGICGQCGDQIAMKDDYLCKGCRES